MGKRTPNQPPPLVVYHYPITASDVEAAARLIEKSFPMRDISLSIPIKDAIAAIVSYARAYSAEIAATTKEAK